MNDDRYDDQRTIGLLLAGFGIGAIVGTVIGLLFAPKSGKELREELKEKGGELFEKTKEKAKDIYEVTREKVGEGYQKVKDAIDTGVSTFREKVSKSGKESEQETT